MNNTILLIIAMEECGEFIQRCSKVIRHGAGEKQLTDLNEEAGDVFAMLTLLEKQGLLNREKLLQQTKVKYTKLQKQGIIDEQSTIRNDI